MLKFPALIILLASNVAYAQTSAIVLPLPQNNDRKPFVSEAIRDPGLNSSGISDAADLNAIESDLAELESDLGRAKAERRNEIYKRLITQQLRVVDYYARVLNGIVDSDSTKFDASQLTAMRRELIQFASQYGRQTKDVREQTWARYHSVTQRFILGGSTLREIQALAASDKLSGAHRARAKALVAALSGDAAGVRAAAGSLPRLSQLSMYLILAQRQATYKQALAQSAILARGQKPAVRQKTLASMVSTWRRFDRSGPSWIKPPFATAAFADLNEYKALEERKAIALHSRGDYLAASGVYLRLARSFEGKLESSAFDLKLLNSERMHYRKSDNYANYEKHLQRLLGKYQDENILGEDQQARAAQMAKDVDGMYRVLVDTKVAQARKQKNQRILLRNTIALTSRYVSRSKDDGLKENYQAIVAELLALDQQHRKAVTLYLDLALNGKEEKRQGYMRGAIASQSILAKWPTTNVWKSPRPRASSDTRSLEDMYARLNEMQAERTNWLILSHLGLLKVLHGSREEAYTLWEKALAKGSSGIDGQRAAGHMLSHYEQTKSWANLERVSRVCLKAGTRPIHQDKPIDANMMLASALLYGGIELHEQDQHAKAVSKLKEFTTNYPTDKRRDQGLYYLAHAYRGDGKHADSINVMTELAQEYRNSRYLAAALVEAGDWSMSMALEEPTIFFFDRYLEQFPTGKQAVRVRKDLVDLYLGRELFAQAIDVMKQNARSRQAGADDRLSAAVLWMDIEDRHGSLEGAAIAAKEVLKLAGSAPEIKAPALVILAKYHLSKNQLGEMQKIERTLTDLGGNGNVSDALGEVRYYLAMRLTQNARKEIFNLELTDPLRTLNDEFHVYQGAKAMFEGVCRAGESSYCAPALLKISEIADTFNTKLDEITIPENLEKSVVKKFQNRKAQILETLADDNQSAIQRSYARIKQTHTRPDFTQQVLWENSTDWNFDRITGEAGNGFVQFEPAKAGKE